jgi:hypothetical protein
MIGLESSHGEFLLHYYQKCWITLNINVDFRR